MIADGGTSHPVVDLAATPSLRLQQVQATTPKPIIGQALPHLSPCDIGEHVWGAQMDKLHTLDLALFLVGTFAAALVTGLAGFAFGIVAAAIWLHVLPPPQATALIVAFGLIVQGVSVWKLRQAIKWDRLTPFLIGGVIGV